MSLDSRVREIINKNMMSPTQRTFDEAQLQIYTLMHRDSYPRFVNSPGYRNLLKTYGGSVRDLTVTQPTWGGDQGGCKSIQDDSVTGKRILSLLYTVTLTFLVNYFVTSSDGALYCALHCTWNFSQNVKNDLFCWPTRIYQKKRGKKK